METGKDKKQSVTAPCSCCGKRRKLTSHDNETELCSTCLELVKNLEANPDMLATLASIASRKIETSVPASNTEPELPEVLDAVRYRTTDRDQNTWYVSVSELDGYPVEVFASTAFDRDHHLQSRISNLTTITRLISLILRHIFMGEKLNLEKVLTQLHRSSRQPNDLPEMLGRVLSQYSNTNFAEEKKDSLIP